MLVVSTFVGLRGTDEVGICSKSKDQVPGSVYEIVTSLTHQQRSAVAHHCSTAFKSFSEFAEGIKRADRARLNAFEAAEADYAKQVTVVQANSTKARTDAQTTYLSHQTFEH